MTTLTLFNRLMSAYGGGGLQNPQYGRYYTGPATRETEASINVSDERAMSVSTVWACARLITQSTANLPLNLFRERQQNVNGRPTTVRNPLAPTHNLHQLLMRPNPYMNGRHFRLALTLARVLWGNGYAWIQRSGDRAVGLYPLHPQYVEPERTRDNRLIYHYSTENRTKAYDQSEILHLKGFSLDGIIGLSPLGYARHTLGIAVSADRYAAKSFKGKPNGTLTVPEFLTKEQRKQMRDLYSKLESSVVGDGNWWLLEGGMKYEAIMMSPDDLQMLESRQFNVPDICRFFGVPAVMVDGSAGSEAAWPASYEQQRLAFLTDTLNPYLTEWEDAIKEKLVLPTERGICAEHETRRLLRSDSKSRSDFYSRMVQNGIMTRNEVRALEFLAPMDGADELTAQVNLAPLDDLGGEDAPIPGQPSGTLPDQDGAEGQ